MTPLLRNPYRDTHGLPWLKGEIHLHTDRHKGRATRRQMIARLRECGFDFAAIADHNSFTPGDPDSNPVLLGNAEMRTTGGDILSLFADVTKDYPGPGADASRFQSPQAVIDAIRAAGGLPILAHPKIAEFTRNERNWAFTCQQLNADLGGYAGLEIYTHYVRSGFQTAVDRLDALWIHRWRESQCQDRVWGFAASDAHGIEDITPNVGILVAAPDRDPKSIRAAIEAGRFYCLAASSARFIEIASDGTSLHVAAQGCEFLALYGAPQKTHSGDRRLLAISWRGDRPHVELVYTARGSEGFLRVEAMDRHGGHIYANPVGVDGSAA